MKTKNIIHLLAVASVMYAGIGFTSCKLDEPEIPVEELYMRNFIKQYGLIDPNQDFNAAKLSDVKVNLQSRAGFVNVYALIGDDYYRVACYADVSGKVTIPIDIPEATDDVIVDVDGVRYHTTPGGEVKVLSSGSSATSRAISSTLDAYSLWVNDWDATTAVNGETKSSQSARAAVTIPSTGVMTGYIDVVACGWVGENLGSSTRKTTLGDNSARAGNYEIGNTSEGANVRFKIDNQCGEMSSYTLSFRTASNNDAKIRVIILGKDDDDNIALFMDRTLTLEDNDLGYYTCKNDAQKTPHEGATQWEIRTEMMPKGEYQMIVYGVEATRDKDNHQYAGNWGFFKLEKTRTVSDMAWIMACEDLGTTDDFDFNDIVIKVEAVNTNTAALNLGVNRWQVVTDENQKFLLHAPARSASSRAGEQTLLRVEALAAGGTLPLWLHFREPAGDHKDYILGPNFSGNKQLSSSAAVSEGVNEDNEWHRWFNVNDHTTMINTGIGDHKTGRKVEFTTESTFSMALYSFIDYDGTIDEAIGTEPWEALDWEEKINVWQFLLNNQGEYNYGFYITVYNPIIGDDKNNGAAATVLGKNMAGLPPEMFLIPDCNPMIKSGYDERKYGWEWPTERTSILSLYPTFKDWVSGGVKTEGIQWFMNPKPGVVDADAIRYSRDPDHSSANSRNDVFNGD